MSEEEKKDLDSEADQKEEKIENKTEEAGSEKASEPVEQKQQEASEGKAVNAETGKKDNAWYCPKCGARNTTNFCSQCGTARPKEKKKDAQPVWHEPASSVSFKPQKEKKAGSTAKNGVVICVCALLCGLGGGLIANGIASQNGSVAKKVDELEEEVADLKKDNEDLKDKVDELESSGGSDMMEIFGNIFGNGNGHGDPFGNNGNEGSGKNDSGAPDLFSDRDKEEVPDAVLGVMVREGNDGPVIQSFSEGSDAEDAGLETGDVIKKIDGTEVSSTADIYKILKTKKAGDTVEVTVERGGEEKTADVKLISSNAASRENAPAEKQEDSDQDSSE